MRDFGRILILLVPLIASCRQSAPRVPELPESQRETRSEVLAEEPEKQEEIQQYRANLEQDPGNYKALLGLAQAYAHSDQREKAIKTYNRLLKRYPEDPDGLLGRGLVHSWNENFEAAERDLRSAARKNPDYAAVWRALGNTYLWWGRYEQAESAFEKLVERTPDNDSAREKLREARKKQEELETTGATNVEDEQIRQRRQESSGKKRWEVSWSWSHTSFNETFDDWRVQTFGVRRELERGSVAVEVTRHDRFSDLDGTVAMDLFHELWKDAYANLRFQYSPEPDFTPRNDTFFELFQVFGDGWEVSGGYRHMTFPASKVDIYSAGLAKYIGNWYLRLKPRYVPKSEDRSLALSARYYYKGGADSFAELRGDVGTKTVDEANNRFSSERRSRGVSLRVKHFFNDAWGVEVSGGYRDEEDVPPRKTVDFGLIFRW